MAAALGALGEVHLASGGDGAHALFVESLQLRLRAGDANGLAMMLELFGRQHFEAGRADRAARLIGATEVLRDTTGARRHPHRETRHVAFIEQVRASLGDAAYAAAVSAGRALSRDEASALALGE